MLRLPALLMVLGIFAGCERSNRNIEVQPVNNKIKPNGQSGDSDSDANVFTTGSLKLRVSGLPSSASSAILSISVGSNVETRNVSLSGGAGVTTLTDLTPGDISINVNTNVGGSTYYGATEINIIKGMISSASIIMGTNSNPVPTPNPNPQPVPMAPLQPSSPLPSPLPSPSSPLPSPSSPSPSLPLPLPSPSNNGGSSGGAADIDIGIVIGGNSVSPSPSPSPSPTPSPSTQNVWDGKSFLGNNMFSIEPLD